MNTDAFFRTIGNYTDLSADARRAWESLLRPRQFRMEEAFIRAGDVPTVYAFVVLP